MAVSYNIKYVYTMQPRIPIPKYIFQRNSHTGPREIELRLFVTALFVVVGIGSNLGVTMELDEQTEVYL